MATFSSILPIDLSSHILTLGNGSGDFNLSGTITGSGGLTIDAVYLSIEGGNNSFTGNSDVLSGTQLDLDDASGTAISGNLTIENGARVYDDHGSQLAANTAITLNGDGFFIFAYSYGTFLSETVAGLQGASSTSLVTAGPFQASRASLNTLTLAGSGSYAYAGQIADGAIYPEPASLGLIKQGSGTQTLSGNSTYTGGTTISGGTLLAGSSSALGTGNVTLSGGVLSTADGNQVINVGGNYTQSGGTLQLTVNNPVQGATYNTLNISGSAALGGTLEVNVTGYTPGQTVTFVLTATSGITGNFGSVVNDQAGNTVVSESLSSDQKTLTVRVSALVSFSLWEANHSFSGSPTDAPQHDGVPNLLKYLYDIDPTQPMSATARAALPTMGINTTGNPGTQYLTLTYRQYALETGTTVNVQTSPDLQNWTTVAVATLPNPTLMESGVSIIQTGNDPNTGDPIIQAQVPFSGTRQFIRLNVTQP